MKPGGCPTCHMLLQQHGIQLLPATCAAAQNQKYELQLVVHVLQHIVTHMMYNTNRMELFLPRALGESVEIHLPWLQHCGDAA